MATNNNSKIINGQKKGNIATVSSEKPINKFVAALSALAILVAIFFIYLEIKKSRESLEQ